MDDPNLWLDFLKSTEDGISINRVVFRKPTITTFSDSSELGIGGFSTKTGIGWRYQLSPEEQQAFTLNTKKYIASDINMGLQMELDPNPNPFPFVLN